MSTSKFRVGLIGAGGIARGVHIPAWKSMPEVEIVAIADPFEAAALESAALIGSPKVFSNWADLLALDLDAVDICTPNKAHTPAVIDALGAGKHVICEKPLATSTAEIREMGAAAQKSGKILTTMQNHRYRSETQAIRQWTLAGALGQVYHARVRAMRRAFLPGRPGFIDESLSGGGPCMDIGVHALDAALWVMGYPKPVRATGTAKTNFAHGTKIPGKWGDWDRAKFTVEDFAAGFVHFDNGATLTLEASWLGHQREDEDFSFQLFGSEAGVHWPSCETSSVVNGVFSDGKLSMPSKVEKAHAAAISAFYNACITGGPSPVPWTESHEVIAILEAIYASQKLGREIVFTPATVA